MRHKTKDKQKTCPSMPFTTTTWKGHYSYNLWVLHD